MKIIITKGDPNDPLAKAFAEPFSLEGEIEYCKLEAVEELLQFMKREGINRGELAERMGVPPSRITRLANSAPRTVPMSSVRHMTAGSCEEMIREISTPRAERMLAHSRFHVRRFIGVGGGRIDE